MARICVIGAGPSGMSLLHWAEELRSQGRKVPEVVCYEKQSNWGGQWNFSWRIGTDEHGEVVHSSMYKHLWSNGPKEALEYPDYTFMDHFGKPVPSFPPRAALLDYLQGRWTKKRDLKKFVKLQHAVRSVKYNESTKKFEVTVEDLAKEITHEQIFDYVIVATGHFSVPNVPTLPGIHNFSGRVLHAHNFKDSKEFIGQRLLMIGSSFSAEDIAVQCLKYGAKSAICAYRTNPLGVQWPKEITEKPSVTSISGSEVTFKDGSKADVDAIIYCTGYLHHHPYMTEPLRLRCPNSLYPENLYKGIVLTKGGDNKCLYMGMQDQAYTLTMFDSQAFWTWKYILGDIKLPSPNSMQSDIKSWRDKNELVKNPFDKVTFQTDYVLDLAKEAEYGQDLNVAHLFNEWINNKLADITTYRDQPHCSKFSKVQGLERKTPFMQSFDDSLEGFILN